ncbi:WW domain-binding protein 4 [Favolaschia claudopus]|uniref:WW domain-binding protein 4 n=1 Tax=Favolaschia claudopus TaxID=2862362 RepID=A0AAW0E0M1_9AGAR
MSEYWVSKKKYFCKYCDIYIADDAPSRQQHENGLRHKGNLERFIRGIYKAGEKKKKDEEEERREMARAAQIAFAQDVGAGRAKLDSSAPVASTSSVSRKPAPKPSNPFANYSTAKSLGYDDPDAERLAAEAEQRRMQGVAGEWEVVAPSLPEPAPSTSSTDASLKRSAEALDEEESREFKLRKKTMSTGLGQIYDPGIIPIKLKKQEVPVDPIPPITASSTDSTAAGTLPKWTKLQWKKMGDGEESSEALLETDNQARSDSIYELPKKEEESASVLDENEAAVKSEPAAESIPLPDTSISSSITFKKRKAPAGGARGRRAGV